MVAGGWWHLQVFPAATQSAATIMCWSRRPMWCSNTP